MTDWHLQHLMSLAMSGAGLVMIEATGVERRGRITHGCVGLYTDANERAMARVHRSWKAQPAGICVSRGMEPSIWYSRFAFAPSTGIEAIKPTV